MRSPLPRTAGLLVLVAAISAATACSSDSSDSARPASASNSAGSGSAGSGSSASDPGALDTGSYATTAQPAFGFAPADTRDVIESQRMAEFTILIQEIDPIFTETGFPAGTVRSLPAMFRNKASVQVFKDNRVVAGFLSSGSNKATPGGASTGVTHAVFRFRDPAGARQASDALARSVLATTTSAGAWTEVAVPALPDSRVLRRSGLTQVFTPFRDYLLIDQFNAPTDPPVPAEQITAWAKRSLELQKPLIARFPQTPLGANSQIQLDQNKILIYTLRDPKVTTVGLVPAVFGPRGIAHLIDNSQRVSELLTAAGSDHNAIGLTNVYRATTADKAKVLKDGLVRIETDGGYRPTSSPAGLSAATCLAKVNSVSSDYSCRVQVGRYVGEATAKKVDDVHQQISAQYRILTQADQSAQ
ncbi:hypothetical protein [Williamsia sp. CHRR-6]|uniref:DUF7373 family lipoprotein n=1 Tax=Williamsia sp. CHRR-6 TaxID=2835871 RepID=UPI001BD95B6F|nr:hypothetical protein [Williamsia sp. CHRR-6]MBT0568560.1 hypothetical protein [Williamsia sp. CHRR-6]